MLVFYNELDKRFSFPLLALTFVISMPFIFGGTKNSKIDRLLGDFSYPLFIVHLLIITVVEDLFDDLPTFIMLVIIFTVALCVFYGIQAPVDRWRQRRVTQPIEIEKEKSGSER
jgi:peptidoglycan/LPS O-acetylase OafA/YrhL